jgi:excisionase family DNA binding protein
MTQFEASSPGVVSDFLTVAEVAHTLRVSPASIRNWIREGRLGSINVGRLKRVRRSALDSFLRRNETEL